MYHVTDPDEDNNPEKTEIEANDAENAAGGGGGRSGAGSGVNGAADWRIALRVEPDAEGPSAGKLKLAAAAGNPVKTYLNGRKPATVLYSHGVSPASLL